MNDINLDTVVAVPCPYTNLPATSYWRKSVTNVAPNEIDPVVAPRFKIKPDDKVSTAGSCFAQHIARYIRKSGFNYFITEPGHPILPKEILEAFNFGTFTARFGNIYTARQLLQLLERSYGFRKPIDDVWKNKDTGRLIDPFRPFIQERGFVDRIDYEADREQHFLAVRRLVEESDVFVFTLGLTEGWENAQDGTVYAICPGCGAGEHLQNKSIFRNFSVTETADDIKAAIDFMQERNPNLRILLTVSPVPLIATFENQHVLTATTYSKSVLRVAAQMAVDSRANVDYFPSFEIITSSPSRGSYFAEDLREVLEDGVSHAMRSFFKNYYGEFFSPLTNHPTSETTEIRSSKSISINKLICDEERLTDA